MKKKIFFLVALTFLTTLIITRATPVYATQEDPLDAVDLSFIENYFDSFDEPSRALLGNTAEEFVNRIKSGETIDSNSLIKLIISFLTSSVAASIPFFTKILSLIIVVGILSGLKSDFTKSGVQSVTDFALSVIIAGLILSYVSATLRESSDFLQRVSELVSVSFPILFTLLVSLGATATTTALQPFVSYFADLIGIVVSKIVLPLTIVGLISSVLSGVSVGFNVKKFNDLVLSFAKSMIFSVFFVFSIFLGVQGIVASVYDGVATRIARFSLGKYVPIIGGYLSEGLNMILAGTVLLKNGLGSALILLIFVLASPVILKTAILALLTKFLAVISSPFECRGITDMLEGVEKFLKVIISSLFAVSLSALVMCVSVVMNANTVI
jgi:stage III sporulation protein AE